MDSTRQYLLDFQRKGLPHLVKRELKTADTGKVVSVIGPRRAGKTSFLLQKIKELIGKGIKKNRILFLNLEDPRLMGINGLQIVEVIKQHWQLFPETAGKTLYIFIDEPQNMEQWEVAVRWLHDEKHVIHISGSSSKLLSKEIATSLRGRTLSYILLPFSFREFLDFNGWNLDHSRLGSKDKAVLLSLLDQYLEYGGFPEVVLEKDVNTKEKILREYINLTIYRDVMQRYKIRNSSLIQWLIKSLTISYAKEISVHKLYLTLKSQGIKVSKKTLYSYTSMLEDTFYLFTIPRFNRSARKRDLLTNKAYICDNGFIQLIETGREPGKRLENMVFVELARSADPLVELNYWKDPKGSYEVDFVRSRKGRVLLLMQSCYNLIDHDTKQKEVRALLGASKNLNCKRLKIITYDYEQTESYNGTIIHYIPVWKWILMDAS